MFNWIFWLLSLFAAAAPADPNFVPAVAAEAAYASLIYVAPATAPKPDTKDCKTCKGTGRVRSGDDQGWTKCPDCENRPGMRAIDAPSAKLTAPGKGWPARSVSSDAQ